MSGVTDPLAWVALAEEDYALAKSSVRRKAPLLYGACFHAQQEVQQALSIAGRVRQAVRQELALP